MEEKKDNQTYQAWYEEISLPIREVKKSGSSLVIIIPSQIIKKYSIALGDHVHPIFFRRNKDKIHSDEKKPGMSCVWLSSREKVLLQRVIDEEKKLEEIAKKLG
jgi:hypothetical protein